jgi:hypothetical protein
MAKAEVKPGLGSWSWLTVNVLPTVPAGKASAAPFFTRPWHFSDVPVKIKTNLQEFFRVL